MISNIYIYLIYISIFLLKTVVPFPFNMAAALFGFLLQQCFLYLPRKCGGKKMIDTKKTNLLPGSD